MRMRAMNLTEGETVELQADLKPTDVEPINGRVVAVLHDSEAEQIEYRREYKRSERPKNANLEVPDSAVVVDFDGSEIHYFEEV